MQFVLVILYMTQAEFGSKILYLLFFGQLTFASTVSMDERLVYSPDPNNAESTVLRQETIITVKGVPLTSYMENYLVNSISNNSFKVDSGGDGCDRNS